MQTLHEKVHPSRNNSRCGFLNGDGRTNVSSHSSDRVSSFDNREVKDGSNNSGSRVVTDSHCHWNDSFGSKHKHHSSTPITSNHFANVINGKQLASHRSTSSHNRSSGVSSRSEPRASTARDINSSVFVDHSSSSAVKQRMKKSRWDSPLPFKTKDIYSPVFTDRLCNSAVKQRVKKKSRWDSPLPRDAQHQNVGKEIRGLQKTPIDRGGGPLISGSAKHTKKTPPSAMRHNGELDLYFCMFLSNI